MNEGREEEAQSGDHKTMAKIAAKAKFIIMNWGQEGEAYKLCLVLRGLLLEGRGDYLA